MSLNSVAMTWGVIALVLMAAEMLIPGVFLLWLGLAAAAVFLVTLWIPDLSLLWQIVLVAIFSYLSVQTYRNYFRGKLKDTDQPLLNRRAEQMIGQTYTLVAPIHQGRGQIQVADAFWTVLGTDMDAGQRIRVVGVDGMNLRVEAESF